VNEALADEYNVDGVRIRPSVKPKLRSI
jgi:hypothetical protein